MYKKHVNKLTALSYFEKSCAQLAL